MDRTGLIRLLSLYVPIAALLAVIAAKKPGPRRATGAGLSFAWNLGALFVLHLAARRAGWWRFEAEGGLLLGFPVDLFLGWALLWGPVVALAFQRLSLVIVAALMVALDLVLMPLCVPVLKLGESWVVGETVAVAAALLPAQFLARWTAEDRHLFSRTTLLVIAFGVLALGILPAAVLVKTGGSIAGAASRPAWLNSLFLQLLVLFAVPGLSGVMEFASRGGGTPFPYDPPKWLVTTGVYSYLANPMQVSTFLVVAVWGAILGNGWVSAGALVSLAYGAGFAAWHEDKQLKDRHGSAWVEYRRHVRPWWPRLRPYVAAPATLYVAETCSPCRAAGGWFRRRSPVGLLILAAETHSSHALTRITYETGDGLRSEAGVAAIARALEHLHLGWAFLAWTLRLPGVSQLVQLIVDAVGGGPRSVALHPAPTGSGISRKR